MNVLIVLNLTDNRLPAENYDFIIGVDGGCKWCLENNLKIDLAVGDFDSLEEHLFYKLAESATETEQHPASKDQTDLEIAIQAALGQSPQSLTVLGVWGGRTDHALANLFCLARQTDALPVTMPGKNQNGYLLKSGHKVTIEHAAGQTVSMLAMLDNCQGISNCGMKYPLTNATLKPGNGLGISNLTIASPAWIHLNRGILLVLTDHQSGNRIITGAI